MAEPLQPSSPLTPPPDYEDVMQKEKLPPSYKSIEAENVVTAQPLPEATSITLQPEEPTPRRCGDSFEHYFDIKKTNGLTCCLCTVFCLPLVATCNCLQMCLLEMVDCCCGNSHNGRYTATNNTEETGAVVSGVDPNSNGTVDSCCLFCCADCSGGYDPGTGGSGSDRVSFTRYGSETNVWGADVGIGGGNDGGFWGGGNDDSGGDSGGWGGGDNGGDSGGGGGGDSSGNSGGGGGGDSGGDSGGGGGGDSGGDSGGGGGGDSGGDSGGGGGGDSGDYSGGGNSDGDSGGGDSGGDCGGGDSGGDSGGGDSGGDSGGGGDGSGCD